MNYQGLDRIEGDLQQLQDELKTLQEKEGYLQTQLASVPTESSDQDRNLLKDLRAKLVQLQSRYSDKYPDVSKTKQDIAELEKRIALAPPDEKSPHEETFDLGGGSGQQRLLCHPRLPAFRSPVRHRIGEKADIGDTKEAAGVYQEDGGRSQGRGDV